MTRRSVPKNPPPLEPGMDNPWYDFSPFPQRPRLTWPRNARVAFCVLLHLEYSELLPAEDSYRDPREALRRIERFGNVWHATPGEIAQHYMDTMMA